MESADNRQPSPPGNQSEESNNTSSLSKTETIKLLNESIDRLESTIKAIGKNSVEELPSSDSINSLLNTTQELADSVVTTPPPQEEAEIASEAEKTPATKTIPTPQEQPSAKEQIPTETTPPKTTAKPKSDPEQNNQDIPSKSKKQENKGLKIISAIAIAIAIVAVICVFCPQINATVSSLSQSEEISRDFPIPSQPQIIDSSEIEPENSTTEVSQSLLDSQPLDSESDIPVETIETSIPQDLKAPGRATNLKIETIEPELTFTPDQTLIAALQAKFADLASSYDANLLAKARVDFPENALTVEITDDWYKLNESRQIKLANDILKRSRQLSFDKLELEDATGEIVARNPVVGDRIIILQSNKTN